MIVAIEGLKSEFDEYPTSSAKFCDKFKVCNHEILPTNRGLGFGCLYYEIWIGVHQMGFSFIGEGFCFIESIFFISTTRSR